MTDTILKDVPEHLALLADGHQPESNRPDAVSEAAKASFKRLEEICAYLFSKTQVKYFSFQETLLETCLGRTNYTEPVKLLATFLSQWNPPEGTSLIFRGDHSLIPEDIITNIGDQFTEKTHPGGKYIIWFLGYSGRYDIIQATKKLARFKDQKELSFESFEKNLLTAGMPDPDFLILTGRSQFFPCFLTYQMSYSELYFSARPWPGFTNQEMEKALLSYSRRERRYGRV